MESQTKNLIPELIRHGEIRTTLSRAKVVQSRIDRLVKHAKKRTLASRRLILSFFGNKSEITNQLVDEIVPKFGNRSSGYTRITRIGARRGDGAMIVKLGFVEMTEPARVETPVAKDVKTEKNTPAKSKTKGE
ncbi:MAG: 50S ribosomal protein L17 [bacterium]|nr:50S ribosomal protein L17 [bacterium]